MALTPEQVLNKHFQTTQFRRGYEERDVDDFLDEIVAEMRSLIEQRDDYLKQLNDCRASKNQGAVRADGATAAIPVGGTARRRREARWSHGKDPGRRARLQGRRRPRRQGQGRRRQRRARRPGAHRARQGRGGARRGRGQVGRRQHGARRGPGEAHPAQHAGGRRRGEAEPGTGDCPRRGGRGPRGRGARLARCHQRRGRRGVPRGHGRLDGHVQPRRRWCHRTRPASARRARRGW